VLDQITPLIITLDEAANIRRTLDRLAWAQRIVIVDSGSTDETLEIIRGYPQAQVIQRTFVDFADQCNFGLSQVMTPWVLSLDADYELSDELVTELKSLSPSESIGGYRARFIYRIHGRPLRGSLYPPRTVLYRKDKAQYRKEGHGHRVVIEGNVIDLKAPIFHDDRKPLARWFDSQRNYAQEEAQFLLSADRRTLNMMDRMRLACWPAPFAALFYALFCRGGILDGWPGWYYALQRTLAEILISLEIIDRRLRNPRNSDQRDQPDKSKSARQ
jgi:glycosyltransferase involved in cell wall biosynthesis